MQLQANAALCVSSLKLSWSVFPSDVRRMHTRRQNGKLVWIDFCFRAQICDSHGSGSPGVCLITIVWLEGSKQLFIFFPFTARKAYFHQLPPPAVLLDRQMGGFDHGRHQADGGGDPKRARGGNKLSSQTWQCRRIQCFMWCGLNVYRCCESSGAHTLNQVFCFWTMSSALSSLLETTHRT